MLVAMVQGAEALNMPSRIDCSIIIPVHNKRYYTRKCLASIIAHKASDSFEIVLVDNASTDGTAVYLEGMARDNPFIRPIINPVNLGFAKACNIGAAAARGEYLVFLNNDVLVTENWLKKLLEPLASNSGIGISGARCLFADGTIQHAGMYFRNNGHPFHPYRFFPGNFPLAAPATELNCVTGACMAFRREEFLHLGKFDEGFINRFEDVDICLRFREAGYKIIYQPEALIIHHESRTPGRFDHQSFNAARLFDKWPGRIPCDEYHFFKLNEAKVLASGLLQPLKKCLPRELAALLEEPAGCEASADDLRLARRPGAVVLQLPVVSIPIQSHLFISLEALLEQSECRLKLYYQTECEPFYSERKTFVYYLHQGPGIAPFVLPPAGMVDDEFNGTAKLEIDLSKTAVSLTGLSFYCFPRVDISTLFLRESYAEQYYLQERQIRLERENRQQKGLLDLAARVRRSRDLFAPNEPIVIFGTGSLAEWILLMLDQNRIKLNCFFDNRAEKDTFQGLPVQKPTYIEGARVIIASMFENEIRLQLRQIGYRDDQIVEFKK